MDMKVSDKMIYAPVIIPTLNRDEHFIRCVESLKKCKYANDTEIFVSVDFPVHEKHQEGYKKIKKYLQGDFSEFKKMNIFYQSENLGAANNMEFLIDKVSNYYDRYISSEDDNEFAYNCLEYLDKGLMLFENDDKVLNICSAQERGPWKNADESAFFIQICPAYGLGCWVEKEQKLRQVKVEYFLNLGRSFSSMRKLYSRSKMCWQQLIEGILWKKNPIFFLEDNIRWCDTIRSIYAINEDLCFVTPQISKIRNWGFDGSGENMKKNDISPLNMWDFDDSETFEFKVSYQKDKMSAYNKYIDHSGCRVARKYLLIAMVKYLLFRAEKLVHK